jgi:protocatechuate 3,4-dioxygenase, alpha subunit
MRRPWSANVERPITPNQTVGPYFRIGLSYLYVPEITGMGDRLTIKGRVLDGDAKPVNDAILEIWQADAQGTYSPASGGGGRGIRGFGRIATDAVGVFQFTTTKPGRVPGPRGALQAPHLAVMVFMRGLLKHLVTRVYFPNEQSNLEDPILNLVPAERRATLVANRTGSSTLEWNVILQGRDETVFFDY